MATVNEVPSRDALFDTEWRNPTFVHLLPWLLIGFAGLMLVAASLLWKTWTHDALRSIGILFPIVSLILTLRVWQSLNWETHGTWWALGPLLYAVLIARSGIEALQVFVFKGFASVSLLPAGLTVYAYASGVVLLLGGVHVWRKAAFPLALLLFINPVPTAFTQVDLPLQYFCARTAHAFALAIGVHPNANQLLLMFAPGFGMFIAPGCNGLRGAITLGYLALVLGYIYRFPFRIWAAAVLGAVSLGYIFNLIRLCALVLFYWAALRFPFLQPHGEGADYLIGVLLFLVAAISVAAVIRWKGQRSIEHETPKARTVEPPLRDSSNRTGLVWKGIAISVLALLGSFSYVQGLVRRDHRAIRIDPFGPQVATILPEQIGKFKLLRTWTESDLQNHVLYRWGAYSEENTLDEIEVGYWLGGGTHYSIQCHLIRGEKPAWQRTETLASADGDSANFDLAFYQRNDEALLEASTLCDKGGCNEEAFLPPQADIAVIGKGAKDFLFRPRSRSLPVLIRQELDNSGYPPEIAKGEMLHTLRDFVAGLNTVALVHIAESMQ